MEVQSSANVDYGSLAEVLVEQVSHQAEPLSVHKAVHLHTGPHALGHMPSGLRHGGCLGQEAADRPEPSQAYLISRPPLALLPTRRVLPARPTLRL